MKKIFCSNGETSISYVGGFYLGFVCTKGIEFRFCGFFSQRIRGIF